MLDIKHTETFKPVYKALFVVQDHTDAEKHMLLHNPATIGQHSIRLFIAVAAIIGFRIWTQDVSQAYLQRREAPERLLHEGTARPAAAIRLMPKTIEPLYGLADSSDH